MGLRSFKVFARVVSDTLLFPPDYIFDTAGQASG